jgi:hypothetical protein
MGSQTERIGAPLPWSASDAVQAAKDLLTDESLAGLEEVKIGADSDGWYVRPADGIGEYDSPWSTTLRSQDDVDGFYNMVAVEADALEAGTGIGPDPLGRPDNR